jgi:hypothetical protein
MADREAIRIEGRQLGRQMEAERRVEIARVVPASADRQVDGWTSPIQPGPPQRVSD